MSEQDPKRWLSGSLGFLGNLFSDGPADEDEEEKKKLGGAVLKPASFKKVTHPSEVHPEYRDKPAPAPFRSVGTDSETLRPGGAGGDRDSWGRLQDSVLAAKRWQDRPLASRVVGAGVTPDVPPLSRVVRPLSEGGWTPPAPGLSQTQYPAELLAKAAQVASRGEKFDQAPTKLEPVFAKTPGPRPDPAAEAQRQHIQRAVRGIKSIPVIPIGEGLGQFVGRAVRPSTRSATAGGSAIAGPDGWWKVYTDSPEAAKARGGDIRKSVHGSQLQPTDVKQIVDFLKNSGVSPEAAPLSQASVLRGGEHVQAALGALQTHAYRDTLVPVEWRNAWRALRKEELRERPPEAVPFDMDAATPMETSRYVKGLDRKHKTADPELIKAHRSIGLTPVEMGDPLYREMGEEEFAAETPKTLKYRAGDPRPENLAHMTPGQYREEVGRDLHDALVLGGPDASPAEKLHTAKKTAAYFLADLGAFGYALGEGAAVGLGTALGEGAAAVTRAHQLFADGKPEKWVMDWLAKDPEGVYEVKRRGESPQEAARRLGVPLDKLPATVRAGLIPDFSSTRLTQTLGGLKEAFVAPFSDEAEGKDTLDSMGIGMVGIPAEILGLALFVPQAFGTLLGHSLRGMKEGRAPSPEAAVREAGHFAEGMAGMAGQGLSMLGGGALLLAGAPGKVVRFLGAPGAEGFYEEGLTRSRAGFEHGALMAMLGMGMWTKAAKRVGGKGVAEWAGDTKALRQEMLEAASDYAIHSSQNNAAALTKGAKGLELAKGGAWELYESLLPHTRNKQILAFREHIKFPGTPAGNLAALRVNNAYASLTKGVSKNSWRTGLKSIYGVASFNIAAPFQIMNALIHRRTLGLGTGAVAKRALGNRKRKIEHEKAKKSLPKKERELEIAILEMAKAPEAQGQAPGGGAYTVRYVSDLKKEVAKLRKKVESPVVHPHVPGFGAGEQRWFYEKPSERMGELYLNLSRQAGMSNRIETWQLQEALRDARKLSKKDRQEIAKNINESRADTAKRIGEESVKPLQAWEDPVVRSTDQALALSRSGRFDGRPGPDVAEVKRRIDFLLEQAQQPLNQKARDTVATQISPLPDVISGLRDAANRLSRGWAQEGRRPPSWGDGLWSRSERTPVDRALHPPPEWPVARPQRPKWFTRQQEPKMNLLRPNEVANHLEGRLAEIRSAIDPLSTISRSKATAMVEMLWEDVRAYADFLVAERVGLAEVAGRLEGVIRADWLALGNNLGIRTFSEVGTGMISTLPRPEGAALRAKYVQGTLGRRVIDGIEMGDAAVNPAATVQSILTIGSRRSPLTLKDWRPEMKQGIQRIHADRAQWNDLLINRYGLSRRPDGGIPFFRDVPVPWETGRGPRVGDHMPDMPLRSRVGSSGLEYSRPILGWEPLMTGLPARGSAKAKKVTWGQIPSDPRPTLQKWL